MAEELVPIFHVKDGYETAKWYARLGFEVEGEHRFAPGLPLYLFLRRGAMRLHLSEHKGDARPGTLVYVYVDDVDTVATEFGVEVKEQPWAREVSLADPDGNRLRIGARRAASDGEEKSDSQSGSPAKARRFRLRRRLGPMRRPGWQAAGRAWAVGGAWGLAAWYRRLRQWHWQTRREKARGSPGPGSPARGSLAEAYLWSHDRRRRATSALVESLLAAFAGCVILVARLDPAETISAIVGVGILLVPVFLAAEIVLGIHRGGRAIDLSAAARQAEKAYLWLLGVYTLIAVIASIVCLFTVEGGASTDALLAGLLAGGAFLRVLSLVRPYRRVRSERLRFQDVARSRHREIICETNTDSFDPGAGAEA